MSGQNRCPNPKSCSSSMRRCRRPRTTKPRLTENKAILELIDRVVRQAERAQRLVHERLPVLPGLARRTLNLHELKALATLIGYQSNNTGFQPNSSSWPPKAASASRT